MKYLLLLLAIILMIFATRSYLNNIAILDAIDGVQKDKQAKIDEINFTQNFLIKYLGSDYADYFLAHENNVLYNREYILRLDMNIHINNLSGGNVSGDTNQQKYMTAPASRRDFLGKKFKTIR